MKRGLDATKLRETIFAALEGPRRSGQAAKVADRETDTEEIAPV